MSPQAGSPPEADLIRLARKARGMTAKEAADRTPIRLSESRWYHIERGWESKTKPVKAPPNTLAHMARVVGVSPERLAEAGREDAAEILREILRLEQQEPASLDAPDDTSSAVDVMDVQTDHGLVMIPVPFDMPEAQREELRQWGIKMARYYMEQSQGTEKPE
ncbi:transcriptional regulator with XRE-family HTH domain [Streptosporangium becharense]|uniref:Transcriptional regulator with XRE-family HTH domain n=1 Tax=Streptosporangium becharense TaxID=1816182 RepID=A0A7W9IPI3_9ACTN|nr:helix-turn-helix transcriptional regulator [Streptosporangium becharense]MBB2909288.1 transcriptional regulator with XRE-family HTH domain [Streptosporangium becharense]MBB5823809.1 transcriptional regulator with XRE-family HTH domain [Streptosporangium becharense]